MSNQCQHKYKDPNRQCPNTCVKGDLLCRKHRYAIKKNPKQYNILTDNGKIKRDVLPDKEESEKEDICSLCTIQENEEVASLVPETTLTVDDSIDITRRFVFTCIDQYFEEHNKRNELLKDMKSSKKSGGGLDLNTILGIGGMSLMPMIANYMKQNMPANNINNNGTDKQEHFINLGRPTRENPTKEEQFIRHDTPEEATFQKV